MIEHFTNLLQETICVWIKERKLSTSLEANKLADVCLQVIGASFGSTMLLKVTRTKPLLLGTDSPELFFY